jgi:hypothetical protein
MIHMIRVTLDSGMLSRLQNLSDFMEIRDERGHVLGYFHPVNSVSEPKTTAGKSPLTDDELRRRQRQRTGKPLAEVLADLSPS